MTESSPPRPRHLTTFPNGELAVVWSDQHESYFPGHFLRCACACAGCVDERTGAKLLREDRVPLDVRPLDVHPVGNYGISIRWSDGHDTGIYAFARLRQLCPCCTGT